MSPEPITPPAVVDAERSTGVEPGTGQGEAQNGAQGVATVGRMRLAPEHFYTAAAEAWNTSSGGFGVDAMDDRLRAAVGAVLDLQESPVGTDTATPAAHEILMWDYRQQPDMDAFDRIVANLTNLGVRIYQVETHTDDYAVVICRGDMTPEEAQRAYTARHRY